MEVNYDIAILGGGPGGYVAAIRASQLGFKTVVIDKSNLGGICLNWGCIPTKSLLKNAELYDSIKNHSNDFGIAVENLSFEFPKIIKRSRDIADKMSKNVEILINKNKVDYVKGFGRLTKKNVITIFDDNKNEVQKINASKIIIATGARPVILPSIPVDYKNIITSTEAMSLDKVPENLVIIGAGAIGIEFAYFYSVFGSHVTIIEVLDNILPVEDVEVSQALKRSLKKRGIEIFTKSLVTKAEVEGDKIKVKIKTESGEKEIIADKVLSAVGVRGNVEGIGLEKLGVELFRDHIKVNKSNYATNVADIYAIGDVIGPPWLAHVASAEGITCIEKLKGLETPGVDYENIPGCTYCIPQVASVGLTEVKAKEQGLNYKVGKFPFMASGKAFAIGEREGFVKVIIDKKYGEILGAHIIGPEATELIAEFTLARSLEATAESVVKTIHAHPTLAETVMESLAQALGEAINI